MDQGQLKSERIAEEVEALRGADGMIHAPAVVSWAREHPESALHSQFEWDDGKAAEEWRIWQARRVIAVYVRSDDGERSVVSLTIDRKDRGGYRSVSDVIANDDLRRVLVRDALAELKRIRAKYERVKELAAVYDEIERADRKYGDQQEMRAA